ncbi:hypothetical protein ACOMHN_016294 [Nucella lapillus]
MLLRDLNTLLPVFKHYSERKRKSKKVPVCISLFSPNDHLTEDRGTQTSGYHQLWAQGERKTDWIEGQMITVTAISFFPLSPLSPSL